MRKIVLFVAALLFMAVPAIAAESNVAINCSDDDVNEVTVSYVSDANLIRAFALDINTNGANITKVDVCDPNYRIYPGQIVIVDGNVTDYNTPYDPCDLGDAKVTIEMGSLYAANDLDFNHPPASSGDLLKFYVDGGCNYKVDVNAFRGGIVMENPDEVPNVTLCDGNIPPPPPPCTVPNVVDMAQADANTAIEANDLVVGDITTDCNDTIAAGNVISTDPAGGTEVDCGSEVDMVVSTGPCGCTVPNVLDMDMFDANDAIVAAGLPPGTITYDYNAVEAAREVLAQNPAPGTVIPDCLTPVDLTVSAGYCPSCQGDLSNNDIKNKQDEAMLRGRLNQSMSQTGSFDVAPSSTLWHPCGDMSGNFIMNKQDEAMLRGQLNQNMSINGTFDVNCPE